MSLTKKIKGWVYPWLPSLSAKWHQKRRKGLFYRKTPEETLECQGEQDRVFWEKFLRPERGGAFCEIGCGDGVVGSHTLGLEMKQGWGGAIWEPNLKLCKTAAKGRTCKVMSTEGEAIRLDRVDLLAIHRPKECLQAWEKMVQGVNRPHWVIVENREPDPSWANFLGGFTYELRWYFHDDEYYELKAKG